MSLANSFGHLFRITTFGESHGVALGCVVDGCPAGISIETGDIQCELDRRRPGNSRYVSQRREYDQVEVLSGLFQGKSTGAPIALLIHNQDARPQDYDEIKNLFRPGHADFSYQKKYGIRDHRGGGRASARETVARVAGGAIAKKILSQYHNVHIQAAVTQVGALNFPEHDLSRARQNPYHIASHHPEDLYRLEAYLDETRSRQEGIGAKVRLEVYNVPPGLGEPVFDKLDARIAYAMMGIPAVKAVSIGDGLNCMETVSSEFNDSILPSGFASNHAGGILGGISTGQNLIVEIMLKPTSSIPKPQKTIDTDYKPQTIRTKGRHDPCVGLRSVPIVEHMMALCLIDFILIQNAKYNSTYLEKRE